MKNKQIIHISGDFDPTLCSGVSASFFDLFKHLNSLGHETYILNFFPVHISITEMKKTLEKMGGTIFSCDDIHMNCALDGVNMSCEKLPYSREEILGNAHPAILKKYVQKIKEFPKAHFITADIDLTSILANVVTKTTFAHHVHSPVVFLETLNKAPMYASFLKNKKVFAVSKVTQKMLEKELGLLSSTWPPFINLNRFKLKESSRANGNIGYYSAGPHKGDKVIRNLITSMPKCHFIVMGNGSPAFLGPPNVTVLGKETDIKKFYSEVSLLLVPSMVAEGFPRVILEASANGIPVIANEVGGIPEALGDSGIMIPTDLNEIEMTNQYSNAMNSFFADENHYKRHSQKANLRAEEYAQDIIKLSSTYTDILFGKL